MRRVFILTVLFSSFFFSLQSASAQSFASTSTCPCTLRGTVVDSVSGQPIHRALVRLTAPNTTAVLTDSEGKFQFEGLPAGLVSLEAQKPGFLPRDIFGSVYSLRDIFNSTFSLAVSLRLAPDSPPAILKLAPESVIFGQVTDERGEPLEGFTINAMVREPGNGQLIQYMPGRVLTDDEGKFRIAGLRPGSYYLVVRQPQGSAPGSRNNSPVPSGFPPVFYPGVNDVSSATPLKLTPGKSVQANLSLKREPFVQISGTVSGYNPRDQVNVMLQDSSSTAENSEIVFDPATGSFRSKWVPPGSYTIVAQATAVASPDNPNSPAQPLLGFAIRLRESSAHSYAHQQINAVSSVSGLHLVLQPTSDIPVLVRGLPASQNPELQQRAFFLVLIAKDRGFSNPNHIAVLENPEETLSSGDVRMMFYGVPPGTYELMMRGPGASSYVESAYSGSVDLLREDLVIGSSGAVPPISVVLRDDPATLSGTVFLGDTPVSALVVLLSSKFKRPLTPIAAGVNGSYTVTDLAPGSYRVFAVDASANFDFQDPAFLQKISSKIQEVTLAPKQSVSLNLELATVEE